MDKYYHDRVPRMRYFLFQVQALVVDILVETIVEGPGTLVAFVEVIFGLIDSIVVVVLHGNLYNAMVFKYMFTKIEHVESFS